MDPLDQTVDQVLATRGTQKKSGIWYGIVENVTGDPQDRRRVQVRIADLHGTGDQVPTQALPWCPVLQRGGGVSDTGSSEIPPVGAQVICEFVQAHEDFPIVMGTLPGAPTVQREALTVNGASSPGAAPNPEEQWYQPAEFDRPKDVPAGSTTRQVWCKSLRGHTITIEDQGGSEFLKIIDRAGQVFEMQCPTTALSSATNIEQRGNRDVTQGTQLQPEALVNQAAWIRLMDVSGQEFILDGKNGEQKVILRNRDRTGKTQQVLEFSAKPGSEYVGIVDAKGSRLEFSASGTLPIRLTDYNGNEIAYDAEKQEIRTTAIGDKRFAILRDLIQNIGNNMVVDVGGSRQVQIGGKSVETVVGDAVENVMGNLTHLVAGAYQMLVANPDPTVLTAFDIKTAIGGIALKVLGLGDLTLTCLAGSTATFGNTLGQISFGPDGMTLRLAGFLLTVDSGGQTASLSCLAPAGTSSSVLMSSAGVITLNGGTIPANSLPTCLFTGALHGTTKVLLPPVG